MKIIFDNVIGSKQLPHGLSRAIEAAVGLDKFAVLEFAVIAVIVIAILTGLRFLSLTSDRLRVGSP